jgi:hypothetical protein
MRDNMRKLLLVMIFCLFSAGVVAQTRIDGGAGRFRGSSKYTANTSHLSFYGTTSFDLSRAGGGIGYTFVLRNQNLRMVNLNYYYTKTDTEKEHVYDLSGSYFWKMFGSGSFRTFLGGGIGIGLSDQRSLIFDKHLTVIIYGIQASLQCEYLIADAFGIFAAVQQEMRCMEKITIVRFRHFLTAGIKIGI